MRPRPALSTLGLVILAGLAACGGESMPALSGVDAETLLAQAEESMRSLGSYHVEVSFGEETDPVSIDFVWRIGGRYYLDAHPEPTIEFLNPSVVEAISLAARGASPSHVPHWSIVALGMAGEPEAVEVGQIDGVDAIHLHASVNHLRAILDSQREIVSRAGIAPFGRSCETEPRQPPRCRDLSYEEVLALQEPEFTHYDRNRATVDVWTGADDHLARRIKFSIPPFDVERDATTVTFDFSQFDQVVPPAPPRLPPAP